MEWERHWDAGFFWNHFTFSLSDWMVPSDSTCPHFVLKIPIERKLVYIILSETEDTVRTGWALQVPWVEQTSRLRCSSDSQLNTIVTASFLFSPVRAQLVEWMETDNRICTCKVAMAEAPLELLEGTTWWKFESNRVELGVEVLVCLPSGGWFMLVSEWVQTHVTHTAYGTHDWL